MFELYNEKRVTYKKLVLEVPIKHLNITKVAVGKNSLVIVRNEKLMYVNTVKINLDSISDKKIKLVFKIFFYYTI